jgi:flagellar hook-associated protein 3 FlgL
MTRIANLSASEHLLGILARTQSRVQDLQTQVATGKRSQTYAGIAGNARELLGLEKGRQMLERFDRNNDSMKTGLDATTTVLDGIGETLRTFRQNLISASSGKPLDAQRASDLQQAAFRAMQDMQNFLNTDVDGRHLFAGSRVQTQPVSLPASTLAEFQKIYDGNEVVYPPTAAAQVGSRGTLTQASTGPLTMTGGDTITATNPGAFAGLKPGTTITISGSSSGNDGTYTIVSSDGDRQITISGALTAGATTIAVNNTVVDTPVGVPDTGAIITIGNWYQGDGIAQTHRLDDDRDFTLSLNAVNPGFEKAMRALGLLCQGEPGTAGGLDQHPERLDQTMSLLNRALDRTADGAPPFGAEASGSLEDIGIDLGFQQVMLANSQDLHKQMTEAFEQRIGKLENADQTEAITLLLDETQALEASYQTLARVRQLSLTKFL